MSETGSLSENRQTYTTAQDSLGAAREATEGRRHLVHVFPSFGIGGVPIRIATVLNRLGSRYRHTIIATDSCFDSRSRVDPALDVSFRPIETSRYSLLNTLRQVRQELRTLQPDLLLTYNWGAVEWGLANSLFPLCRHVHFESGFGPEEAEQQITRRVLFRRVALARAHRLVVPSQTLVEIASQIWRISDRKLMYVPNGVDCARFAAAAGPSGLLPASWGSGELVVGTVAPLRAEKNLGRLLRAFAAAEGAQSARLVIAGDGPERLQLEALGRELGIAERLHFTGFVDQVERILADFDIFALSSDTEQMPNSVLQAMAAGLPIAATDVGDVAHIISPENRRLVVAKDSPGKLSAALDELLSDATLRGDLGSRNQAHVRSHYDFDQMVEAYEQIFAA